jgi:hypothetical protein
MLAALTVSMFGHEMTPSVVVRRVHPRAPLAGLLLALPALAATGLLETAFATYAGLPNGFYSLDTMFCERRGPGRRLDHREGASSSRVPPRAGGSVVRRRAWAPTRAPSGSRKPMCCR